MEDGKWNVREPDGDGFWHGGVVAVRQSKMSLATILSNLARREMEKEIEWGSRFGGVQSAVGKLWQRHTSPSTHISFSLDNGGQFATTPPSRDATSPTKQLFSPRHLLGAFSAGIPR